MYCGADRAQLGSCRHSKVGLTPARAVRLLSLSASTATKTLHGLRDERLRILDDTFYLSGFCDLRERSESALEMTVARVSTYMEPPSFSLDVLQAGGLVRRAWAGFLTGYTCA